MARTNTLNSWLCAIALTACGTAPMDPAAVDTRTGLVSAEPSAPVVVSAQPSSTVQAASESVEEKSRAQLAALVNEVSEPDTYFFSDNLITNETSYLQVVPQLKASNPSGGAYIGVGPEQNFTYIAATRPAVAFIVDIRRANMLVHLLHKAAFELANDRAEYVALLLGRPFDKKMSSKPEDGAKEVLSRLEEATANEASFTEANKRLMTRIETYGITLSAGDREGLRKSHRTFYEAQLELRFELHAKNGRTYPTLRELLQSRGTDGKQAGYLGSAESFAFIAKMQREHKIIPIVGDFAGDKALPGIASFLKHEGLSTSAFYVSNVEQYLLDTKVWPKWLRNVAALPKDEKSVFIRAYLDQGKKHPLQEKGHRTATFLQKMTTFDASYANTKTTDMWTLSTTHLASK